MLQHLKQYLFSIKGWEREREEREDRLVKILTKKKMEKDC